MLMFYIDPVCKKKIRKKEEYAIVKYGETVYHLCCHECKEAFDKNPEKYHVRPQNANVPESEAADGQGFVDPVCGKRLRAHTHTLFMKYKGRTYRFCSTKCVEQFKRDPDRYAKTSEKPTSSVEAGIN